MGVRYVDDVRIFKVVVVRQDLSCKAVGQYLEASLTSRGKSVEFIDKAWTPSTECPSR